MTILISSLSMKHFAAFMRQPESKTKEQKISELNFEFQLKCHFWPYLNLNFNPGFKHAKIDELKFKPGLKSLNPAFPN